jgi:hypothetical protein
MLRLAVIEYNSMIHHVLKFVIISTTSEVLINLGHVYTAVDLEGTIHHSPPAGKIKILVLYTWLYSSTFIFCILV